MRRIFLGLAVLLQGIACAWSEATDLFALDRPLAYEQALPIVTKLAWEAVTDEELEPGLKNCWTCDCTTPNELHPLNSVALIDAYVPKKTVYVGVGTVRVFSTAALADAAYIISADLDPKVTAYNYLWSLFLLLSKDRADLRYLHLKASASQIQARARAIGCNLSLAHLKSLLEGWERMVRRLVKGGAAQVDESSRRQDAEFYTDFYGAGQLFFAGANPLREEELYRRLKLLVGNGKIALLLGNLSAQDTQIALTNCISATGYPLGLLDLSNAMEVIPYCEHIRFEWEYMYPVEIAALALRLQSVSTSKTVVLSTSNSDYLTSTRYYFEDPSDNKVSQRLSSILSNETLLADNSGIASLVMVDWNYRLVALGELLPTDPDALKIIPDECHNLPNPSAQPMCSQCAAWNLITGSDFDLYDCNELDDCLYEHYISSSSPTWSARCASNLQAIKLSEEGGHATVR